MATLVKAMALNLRGMADDREKQKAHGAQSDQGDTGQKMRGPEPQKPYYEGAEEHNQQRRSKGQAHYPYEGKEDEAQPGNLGHVGDKDHE